MNAVNGVSSGGGDGRPSIGLNLTWLVPGVVGGSEEYTVRLLTGVGRLAASKAGLRVYGRRELFEQYPELTDPFVPVVMPGRRITLVQRIALERTWLARVSASDAVLHHMGGTVPFTRRRGRPTRQRVAVTIHDLQPIDLAHNFSAIKRTWLGRLIPYSVDHADLVVCPSRFTGDRIVDLYGTDPSKLRVVQQGYHVDRSAETGEPSPALVRRFEDRRFVLYPAITYRHKRHRDLIDALGGLPDRLADIDVVFCGRPGPESDRLVERASMAGVHDRIHVLGRVPEADLRWLYDHALALTFPSEYEGFGNPCLEAMARGCPVLASNAAALPEVVDGAGRLVPTGDVDAWIRAIVELADDPDLVADLRRRGCERAAAFDPGIASRRLWAVYRELLGLASVAAGSRDPT